MENRVRVADEVWIAVASLHRRHPDRADFAISEIMAQAESANVTGITPLRPGVKVHAYLHCVANKPPNPGRYRMLFETAGGRSVPSPAGGRKGHAQVPRDTDPLSRPNLIQSLAAATL